MTKKAVRNLPLKPSELDAKVKELSNMSVDDLVAQMFPQPNAPSQAEAKPPAPKLDDLSVDELVAMTGVELPKNEVTGDVMPAFADGSSPQTPMNKSILSPTERFKLSLGNDKESKIKFLRERYEDAGYDTDGNLVIKNQGNWYVADAQEGFLGNVKNAWEFTENVAKTMFHLKTSNWEKAKEQMNGSSEFMGDMAEAIPSVTKIVGQLGAAFMTKGRSLFAQGTATGLTGGVASSIETSMGKFVGTYEGDPVDQIQEAGIEMLLNAGGQTILPGLGQAATKTGLIKALENAGKTLSSAPAGTKAALADFASQVTKVGKPQMERYLERPAHVMSWVKRFEKNPNFEQDAFEEQIKLITKAAPEARQTMTADYGKKLSGLATRVGDDFTLDVSKPAQDALMKMNKMGLVKLQVKDGKIVPSLRSQDELDIFIRENGGSEALHVINGKKEAYDMIKEYYRGLASRAQEGKILKGAEAIKRFQQMDSTFGKDFNAFKLKALDLRLNSLVDEFSPIVKGMHSNLDNQVATSLQKAGKADIMMEYTKLKAGYRESLEQADSLLDVADIAKREGRQAARDKAATLINKLVGGGKLSRTQQATRGNLNQGIETLTDLNPNIGRMFDKVADIEAGYQFTPRFNRSFVQFGPIQLGIGMTAAFASEGDPSKLAGAGAVALGTAAVAAPRTLLHVMGANKRAGQIFSKAMLQGRQNLMKMTPEQRKELLANPQLLKQYQGTIINSVQEYVGTHEMLMKQVEQGVMGGQQ